MSAIRAGIVPDSTKAALEKAEAERATLRQTLAGPQPKGREGVNLSPLRRLTAQGAGRRPGEREPAPSGSSTRVAADDAGQRERPASLLRRSRALFNSGSDGGDYAGLLRLAMGKIKVVEGTRYTHRW